MSPPFDAKKYKALMGGLEAVELTLSELLNENDEFRLDSDYFSKYNLEVERRLLSVKYNKIGDFAFVTDGIHASIDFDATSKINLISAKAPKFNTFDLSSTGFISEKQHSNNARTALKVNDIVLSTVGTIGNCAVVGKDILPANCDRHVGIIRIDKEYLPHYVSTFLLSKYGMAQSIRHTTGNVQPNLFIYKIRNIIVPFISDTFQTHISEKVIKALHLLEEAENLYTSAETQLLSALGMDNFVPSESNFTIKLLSESFGATGRLDAEYYQQKYMDIENALNTSDTVGSLCQIHDGLFVPNKGDYKYVELANIGTSGNITGCTIAPFNALPTRARRLVTNGQVIVSSIEGSLSSCALIPDDYDGAICSTGFYVLDSSMLNSETLIVLFKSAPIQALMKKRCSGTILTAISRDALEDMPLPLIDIAVQQRIAADVRRSFALRRQSGSLLEIAKRAVEIAVEEGEKEALAFIEKSET